MLHGLGEKEEIYYSMTRYLSNDFVVYHKNINVWIYWIVMSAKELQRKYIAL